LDEQRLPQFSVTYSVPFRGSTLVFAHDEEEAERIALARWRERRTTPKWAWREVPEEPEEVDSWLVNKEALALADEDDEALRADDREVAVRLRAALIFLF
jgi:hypothetical protein